MSYQITTEYCWYNEGQTIVKMYFVSGVPFTFDELPTGHLYDKDILEEANNNKSYEIDDLFRYSDYLIEEEAHPCLFMMDIKNPEDLPDEKEHIYDEGDLTN